MWYTVRKAVEKTGETGFSGIVPEYRKEENQL